MNKKKEKEVDMLLNIKREVERSLEKKREEEKEVDMLLNIKREVERSLGKKREEGGGKER